MAHVLKDLSQAHPLKELSQHNLLFASFPRAEQEHLLPLLEHVPMPLRQPLFDAGKAPLHVHFMTTGIASIVTEMKVGEGVEVGLIGREGMPECMHLLGPETGPSVCFIQLAGDALRMRFADYQKLFLENEAIRRATLRFVQYQALVTGQLAACNRLHEVEERLARWLLMTADRAGRPEMDLTQEFLAEMLGTRRSTVTLTAGALQRSGLIQYNRGRLQILDRERLEQAACECYAVTKQMMERLYP